ncbi:hypothetical protein WDK33_22890 [Escherichia coli]|nr:hypothetical protein [Escherichia coli]
MHFHKRWFGRRLSITRWCPCSLAFCHTSDRLVEMQRCGFFC